MKCEHWSYQKISSVSIKTELDYKVIQKMKLQLKKKHSKQLLFQAATTREKPYNKQGESKGKRSGGIVIKFLRWL